MNDAKLAAEIEHFVSKGWDNGVSRYQLSGWSSGREWYTQMDFSDDDLTQIARALRRTTEDKPR